MSDNSGKKNIMSFHNNQHYESGTISHYYLYVKEER